VADQSAISPSLGGSWMWYHHECDITCEMRMAVHLEVGLVWCSSAALCGNTLCGNTLCGNKPCGNKLCGNTPYHGRLRHAVTFALIRMVKIACIRIQEEYTSELLDIRRRAMELGAYPLATCRVWPVEGEVPWGVVCRFILCFHISSVLLMARHATMLTCQHHALPQWHIKRMSHERMRH